MIRLTQADLAAGLGVHAQQVQRYEANGCETARLARIQEVGTLSVERRDVA